MGIKKAVIPVAGLGTRMLPATKAIPKEMLPVVDKPLIQYVIEEAAAAGIKEIVLVTHASKNAIENHFDTSFELEAQLESRLKRSLLAEVRSITPPGLTVISVRQAKLSFMISNNLWEKKNWGMFMSFPLIKGKSHITYSNYKKMIIEKFF